MVIRTSASLSWASLACYWKETVRDEDDRGLKDLVHFLSLQKSNKASVQATLI